MPLEGQKTLQYSPIAIEMKTLFPRRPDGATAVLLAFVAGLLLGVPLTFCALYVGSVLEEAGPPPKPHPTLHHSWPLHRKSSAGKSEANRTLDPEDLVHGVFWTDLSESFLPDGFGDADDTRWHAFLNTSRVLGLEGGCGRMQNRLLTFSGGEKACARYRLNVDQIQGEIFSFYLARLLRLRNLPPSALAIPDYQSQRWSAASSSIARARWNAARPAVLTRFVNDLQPAFVPAPFRRAKGARMMRPLREDLSNLTTADVSELVQWSDLIIFDYLTANLDRMVNNLFNERWDSQMMDRSAHNLARTPAGLLLFLDNESGLLHGYRLLDKYQSLHHSLLSSLCVFRTQTVHALTVLRKNVRGALAGAYALRDPGMQDQLPFLPEPNIRKLEDRMDDVLLQILRMARRGPPQSHRQKVVTEVSKRKRLAPKMGKRHLMKSKAPVLSPKLEDFSGESDWENPEMNLLTYYS